MEYQEKILQDRLPKAKLSKKAQFKFLIKFFGLSVGKTEEVAVKNMSKKHVFAFLGVLVILLAMSVAVFAYNSKTVTVHDSLFVIKRAGEKMKVAISSGFGEVKANTQIAERRLAEFKYLLGLNGNNNISFDIKLINTAMASENGLSDEEEAEISDTLEMMIQATEDSMNSLEKLSESVEVEEALELIEELQEEELEVMEEALELEDIDEEDDIDDFKENIALTKEKTKLNKQEMERVRERVREKKDKKDNESKIIVETSTEKQAKSISPEELEDLLGDTEEQFNTWKTELLDQVSEEDTQKLLERIDDRFVKIQEAIADGKINQAQGLIKSVDALKNNAKHFIKSDLDENYGLPNKEINDNTYNIETNDKASNIETSHGSSKKEAGNNKKED